jgi:hypothetical protein
MRFSFPTLVAGLGFLFAATAYATEDAAESCLTAKIWAGYSDGWAVRTATTTTLKQEEHRVYLLTLYAGNEYKIQVCADEDAKNIDLVLHDLDGKELLRDESDSREPTMIYKPEETQTYYVAVQATELKKDAGESGAGVALAVTYK